MAQSRPKMALEVACRKCQTMIPRAFEMNSRDFVNYALVRLNAQKRVLKAERPNPYLDIYLKKRKSLFLPRAYIAFFFLVISLNMV